MKIDEHTSSSLLAAEDIGPQLPASDAIAGDVLDGWPIDGFEVGPLVQPVRDKLLADTLSFDATQEFGHAISKRGLASGDLDGEPQSSNVVCFHSHPLYKQACTNVNKATCMTLHKAPCTVLPMSLPRRKPKAAPKKPARKTAFRVGADGRTANDRFREAFEAWRAGDRPKSEQDLERACNVIAGRSPDADPPYVSQQMINSFKNDVTDAARSSFLDVLAEALDVRIVWLRLGMGEKDPDRGIRDRLRALLETRQ